MDYEYQSPTGAAISFVNQGWGFFEDKIVNFANGSTSLIGQLVEAGQAQTTSFSINFPNASGLTSFHAPVKPTLEAIEVSDFDIPEIPDLGVAAPPSFTNAPTYTQVRAELERDIQHLELPEQPDALDVTFPEAPAARTIIIPTMDAYDTPTAPVLRTITIPDFPTLKEINFDIGASPELPVLPDLSGVNYTETPYTREVINEVAATVRAALAGGTTVATHVEDAIFERARDRLTRAGRKSKNEASELFAARGYTEPPGAWAERIAEQRQLNDDKLAEANRDLVVYVHEKEIEAVKNAIVQGIALEQVTIAQHTASEDRKIQVCRLLLDTHVALHNASVAVYNAAQEGRKVDAALLEAELRFELSKLEEVKLRIDAQRLIGEVNKNDVELYKEQWAVVEKLAVIFKTKMDGAEIEARIGETEMRGYESFIRGIGEKVRAHEAQWGGFTAAVNAQGQYFQNFKIGCDAFATRITAHTAIEREKSARTETDLKRAALVLQGFEGRLSALRTAIAADAQRVAAISANNTALAGMFTAEGNIEQARTEANNRAFAVASADNNNRVQAALSEAQIKVQNAERIAALAVESLRGAAAAYSQLTASAMSAVNFSANVSGSGSENISQAYSLSKSRGFNWQGETPDNSSPDIF